MVCPCCIKRSNGTSLPPDCGEFNGVLSKDPFGDGSEIAYFKLDGNSDDEHGTYSGADVPAGSEWINGPSGLAYRNNEAEDLWFADKQEIMDIVNQNNSYSFWFKNINAVDHHQFLLCMGQGTVGDQHYDEASGSSIFIPKNGSKLMFFAEKNDPNNYVYSETIFEDPNTQCWQHICVTEDKNAQKYKLYFNGTFVQDVNYTGDDGWEDNVNGSIGSLRYGDMNSTPQPLYKFKGDIDDVRIFNKVLTHQEVKRLYDGV